MSPAEGMVFQMERSDGGHTRSVSGPWESGTYRGATTEGMRHSTARQNGQETMGFSKGSAQVRAGPVNHSERKPFFSGSYPIGRIIPFLIPTHPSD